MKNELFYSLKKLKGILNYIIIITGDTVKCGVNIVIYATHTLTFQNKQNQRPSPCPITHNNHENCAQLLKYASAMYCWDCTDSGDLIAL